MTTRSSDYEAGYKAGYKCGERKAKKINPNLNFNPSRAYWIMRKDGWYCSKCNTKHEQAHDDYCCKCGCKMSEEAGYEDN